MTRTDHMGPQDLADAEAGVNETTFDFWVEHSTKHEVANALWRREAEKTVMLAALRDALPMLLRLGDFIGNAEKRCETIMTVRHAIAKAEGK